VKLRSWKFIGLVLFLLSTQSAAAETHELILLDEKPFIKPETTTRIGSGDTVKWVNPPREDGGMHTVTQQGCFTADACDFDSEILVPGDEFTYTFSEPGVYEYRCRQHFAMRGTIVVETEKEQHKRLLKERKEREKRERRQRLKGN